MFKTYNASRRGVTWPQTANRDVKTGALKHPGSVYPLAFRTVRCYPEYGLSCQGDWSSVRIVPVCLPGPSTTLLRTAPPLQRRLDHAIRGRNGRVKQLQQFNDQGVSLISPGLVESRRNM